MAKFPSLLSSGLEICNFGKNSLEHNQEHSITHVDFRGCQLARNFNQVKMSVDNNDSFHFVLGKRSLKNENLVCGEFIILAKMKMPISGAKETQHQIRMN